MLTTSASFSRLGNPTGKQLIGGCEVSQCVRKPVTISRVPRKKAKPALMIDIWKITEIENIFSQQVSPTALLEANNSWWTRHRGHRQASRFAKSKRMASRAFSSTRKQYVHTQPQTSSSEWQDWTNSSSSIKKMVNQERTAFPSPHIGRPVDTLTYLKQRRSFGSPRLEGVLHGLSGGSVQKHSTARIFFSAFHALRAGTHTYLCSAALLSSSATLTLGFSLVLSDRVQLFDRATENPPGAPSTSRGCRSTELVPASQSPWNDGSC